MTLNKTQLHSMAHNRMQAFFESSTLIGPAIDHVAEWLMQEHEVDCAKAYAIAERVAP